MNLSKVCLITLGCPKNLVESEGILALLGENGYVLTDSFSDADIIIVNTCGFIKDAVEESIEVIRELGRNKKKGQKIVVYGCLVNRYKKNFPEIKGVDMLAGGGNPARLIEGIKEGMKDRFIPGDCSGIGSYPRLVTTYPFAYLKISDGCNNFCSYCLIPEIRGRLRSRDINEVVEEADCLQMMGIKELIIVSQDTGNYGKDVYGRCMLGTLLEKLTAFNFFWVRVMYMHPVHLTDDVLEIISKNRKICRYLDIPLQHIHPDILKRMNRPVIDYDGLIDRIRKTVPGIKLRTTIMVGFPGEEEKHFKMLLDFIKAKRFDHLGVFRYSREEGTVAYRYDGQVDEEEKEERERTVMEIQRDISRENLKGMVGEKVDVLIEGKEGKGIFKGRTEFDAPEIDGVVYVKAKRELKVGDICKVVITSSDDYDLYGQEF